MVPSESTSENKFRIDDYRVRAPERDYLGYALVLSTLVFGSVMAVLFRVF
jgi:hypothetical protein